RGYIPFSFTDPVNPVVGPYAPGSSYQFYGGALLESYDRPLDVGHWLDVYSRGAFDQLYYSSGQPGITGWAIWLWKQEDFLAGKGEALSLDGGRRLELLDYQGADGVVDYNSGRVRFVVRDGS